MTKPRIGKTGDPARQDRILKILGDRARPVIWDKDLKAKWQTRWDAAKAVGQQTDREAFRMTPTLLIDKIPKRITGVVAVAAFESPRELRERMDLKEISAGSVVTGPAGADAQGRLAAVIGREFLVPDDPGWKDDDLLQAAVDLSGDNRFKRKRAAYWRWQREFLQESMVLDQSAIDDAVDEMRGLVEDEESRGKKSQDQIGSVLRFCGVGRQAGRPVGRATGALRGGRGVFILWRLGLRSRDRGGEGSGACRDVL